MSVTADCDLWIQAIDRPSQGAPLKRLVPLGQRAGSPRLLPHSSAGDPQRKMNSSANIRRAPPGSIPVNTTGRDEEASTDKGSLVCG